MSSPISATDSPATPVNDPLAFSSEPGQLVLRPYQAAPLEAIVDSVRFQRGLSFVVIFPRQSGKNETQAALFTYLLCLFSKRGGDIIAVSPTYKPQTENAMHRLESRLNANPLARPRWRKKAYIYRIGAARCVFFSGEQTANVVGHTASLLLSVDEAQDVSISKYDKDFEPMVASTNATRVFWGTRWTSDTLLEREYAAAAIAEKNDGRRRVFFITADDVSAVLPPYAAHVATVIAKHGRDHPLVRTQYFGETIDAESGMFPPARMALLKAAEAWRPGPEAPIAFLIDCAGTDEAQRSRSTLEGQGEGYLTNPGRDSTALSITALDLSELMISQAPIYRVYQRHTWQGSDALQIYGQVTALAETRSPQYFVIDGTGVGDGLAALLTRRYGPERVIVVRFNVAVKSDIGYRLISIVNTGRLRLHAFPRQVELQYEHARAEVLPGAAKHMRWGVPEGARDKQTGDLIHDDYLMADALTAKLDALDWHTPTPPMFAYAPDPLKDMDTFKP